MSHAGIPGAPGDASGLWRFTCVASKTHRRGLLLGLPQMRSGRTSRSFPSTCHCTLSPCTAWPTPSALLLPTRANPTSIALLLGAPWM
jgi:hypothetical protein